MDAQTNSNDRLMSLLTYPIPIVGVIVLLVDSMKNNPVLRTHAIQSLVLSVVLLVVFIVINFIPILGQIVSCIGSLIWLGITIYYGVQAYNGKDVTIPFVTDFCRGQKWI
jgi:uncharacterized membrane protein